MGAQRTSKTVGIFREAEIVGRIGVAMGRKFAGFRIRSFHEWRSVFPPADDLGREQLAFDGIVSGGAIDEIPETGDVL